MTPIGPALSLALTLAQQEPPQPTEASGYILWAAVLIGVAILLLLTELVIPSAGLLGFFSAASMFAAIVLLFQYDTAVGLVGAILALVALPVVFAVALKVLPHTPIVKRLRLKTPDAEPASPHAAASLLNAQGTALTDLRPVGTCLIAGQRVECLAETGLIRAGSKVLVTHSQDMEIKVRPEP